MDLVNLQDSLARAQKLMLSEDFNAKVEGIAKTVSGKGGAAVDFSSFERQAFGDMYENKETPAPVMLQESGATQKNMVNKLPAAIRESFTSTPPMTGENSMSDPVARVTSKMSTNPTRQMINETSTPVSMNAGGGIDYSLIRSIVEESVRRNIEEVMKKGVLNESTNVGVAGLKMMKGNRIQLVDTNGNLYEGVMTLKRKAAPK